MKINKCEVEISIFVLLFVEKIKKEKHINRAQLFFISLISNTNYNIVRVNSVKIHIYKTFYLQNLPHRHY